MRVLTWNLFHGRADPPAGRPLLHEFASALASWEWDVALLQEVPPWWPLALARACGADHRSARTSRNAVLPVRRAIASRAPDLLRSNGGGSNAILVRPPLTLEAHGVRRLRWSPERRVAHAVRLGTATARQDGAAAGPGRPGAAHPAVGTWVGNVHAQLGRWERPDGGDPTEVTGRPGADVALAADRLAAWARDGGAPAAPLLLGGDLNLPAGDLGAVLPPGWRGLAAAGPDHLTGRGLVAEGPPGRPDRGDLSDHAPLLRVVRPTGP